LLVKKGHIDIVKILVNDQRVDICQTNYYGQTPFLVACEKGRIEIVKLLLNDQRVDVNKTMNGNQTPFYIACWNGQIEVVKLLLNDQRIDVNKAEGNHGITPFYVACQFGYLEIVKLLVNDQRVNVNEANYYDQMPFFLVCKTGDIEIVKSMLASGRDINVKDDTGKTALEIVREEKFLEGQEKKKENCSKIFELLESFERNPNETRTKLRKELGE